MFPNYRRNKDEAKCLLLNYLRNEDEAKFLFLNYLGNEGEAKYSFLNYRWFAIANDDAASLLNDDAELWNRMQIYLERSKIDNSQHAHYSIIVLPTFLCRNSQEHTRYSMTVCRGGYFLLPNRE